MDWEIRHVLASLELAGTTLKRYPWVKNIDMEAIIELEEQDAKILSGLVGLSSGRWISVKMDRLR